MSKRIMPTIARPGNDVLRGAEDIADEIGKLSSKSGFRTLLALGFDYACIVGAIWLFHVTRHPAAFILSFIVSSARAQAIGVIGHDASHGLCFKSPKLNEHIGRWLISYPLFVFSVSRFRKVHLQHHRRLNSDADPDYASSITSPDFRFPQSRVAYLWMLLKTFFFGGLIHYSHTSPAAKEKKGESLSLGYWAGNLIFWAVLVSLAVRFDFWFELLSLWLLPLLTGAMLAIKIRMIFEHFGLKHDSDFSGTRNVETGCIERFLFAPHNVSHHLSHHLYPSVPFYNLPKVTKLLKERTNFCDLTGSYDGYFLGKRPAIKGILWG